MVLALVSGALRRYLIDRSTLPKDPLVGMCPVSVRTEDEQGRPDNRVSAMFVHMRTDIADPARRLRAIARATKGAKADHTAVGAKFIQNWAEQAHPARSCSPPASTPASTIADRHPPIYNVVVSNVPGPDFPLYLDGAELVATYPMGPVMEGAGLNVTVLSYIDNVDFGFLAGAELVPDVWDMADVVDGIMADLLAAADEIDPPPVPAAPLRQRERLDAQPRARKPPPTRPGTKGCGQRTKTPARAGRGRERGGRQQPEKAARTAPRASRRRRRLPEPGGPAGAKTTRKNRRRLTARRQQAAVGPDRQPRQPARGLAAVAGGAGRQRLRCGRPVPAARSTAGHPEAQEARHRSPPSRTAPRPPRRWSSPRMATTMASRC